MRPASEPKLIACERCAEWREYGEWSRAKICGGCQGTGIIIEPTSHICNQCGHALAAPGGYPYGLVQANVTGGFESEHLSEDVSYNFTLCEKCVLTLFRGFTIAPTLRSCISADTITFTQDERRRKC